MCWLPGFASIVQVIYESTHHIVPYKFIWLLLISQRCLYMLLKQKYWIFMLNFYICKVKWNYFHSSISSYTFHEWIRKVMWKIHKLIHLSFLFIWLLLALSHRNLDFSLHILFKEVIIPGIHSMMMICQKGKVKRKLIKGGQIIVDNDFI